MKNIVFPQIFVATFYPGPPEDVENLITKEIEKEVKSISGIKKVSSNSVQDFSSIIVEFQTDVEIDKAKQDVKDAVDRAKQELPSDLENDPQIIEMDISEVPIMNINISGDFSLESLKEYGEDMQDRIESLTEIRRVDIVGALDREIQINVDMYRLALAGVSLDDIADIVLSLQNKYIPNLNKEECLESIAAVLKKREVQNAIITGIELDKLAEQELLSEPLLTILMKDEGLYGIDEILALSIVNLYGSIGFTNYGYLDKIKPGVIAKLNEKDGKQCHTFLDDIVAAIAAAAASRLAHNDPDKSAITNQQ